MSYFATAYTIHFDDTMAYGSHHFLTGFKFQCAAREALLYGDLIFDKSGVPEALDQIHLFTADAYSRNLRPTFLGDRVAILITLEEWGRVSARFCYRVLNREGLPICAGFQNMICADAKSGAPIPLPEALREAFDAIRAIEEPSTETTFRDNVLKSVEATENLFPEQVRAEARAYLADRYPVPKLIGRTPPVSRAEDVDASHAPPSPTCGSTPEVWVFPGQGAFDAQLLSKRILAADDATRDQLRRVADVVGEQLTGDVHGLLSGQPDRCHAAVLQTPDLSQVAIHLQSVLGAWQRWPSQPPALLVGHSFGELAALNVAGCFDLATAIQIVCHRVQAIRQHAPADGGLLVVPTSRRVVAEEITVGGFPDVVIAGRNHEQQTVASGPQDQLDALRKQLQAQQTQAISIASPTCFHHPLLRSAAQAWLSKLRELPLSAPRLPVYSPIGRRLITESDDIASVLASQFLRPFDLQGAIEDLSTGGFREFVDCGSTGSLGRLLVKAGGHELHITNAAETEPKSIGPPPNGAPPNGAPPKRIRSLAGDDGSEAAPRPRPRVAIIRQGCLLPGRVTSPASLHSAIMEGRQGIIDQREIDPEWEHDFYAAELAPDSSTSALAGRVDDEDIQPPPGMDVQQFAGFSRAQQLLCCALAPCADVLRDSGRLVCLLGTTADGFRDQDQMAALRQAGVDVADPQIAARLGTTPAAALGPFQAVQAVLDAMIGPEVKLRLIDAACASSLYAVALGMYALESFEADV
ncbi:MAG: acyltransferase domain-containing protein, partial [Planctomycetota bacterium]